MPVIFSEVLLKVILVAVVIGIWLQAVNIYLAINSQQLLTSQTNHQEDPQNGENEESSVSPDGPEQTETDQIKLIVYSYTSLQNLPHADLITEILSEHPDVLYFHHPER